MTTEPADIERVPLGSLKRYLKSTGWRLRVLPSGLEMFILGPDEDEIEIVLPPTSRVRDIEMRIAHAVRSLSALERRDAGEVISAIRSLSYDLVLSKLPDGAIRHDTITFRTAREVVRRMGTILRASAQAELHSQPYYLHADSAALRYADECRFGHTFRGSFGFTIESPVGPNTDGLIGDLPVAPPLGRRVVQRLVRGLQHLTLAVADEDPDLIVLNFAEGLNANACEELAHLVTAPQVGEIDFEIVLSPEWGRPDRILSSSKFSIKQGIATDLLLTAAKSLREVNYVKRKTIQGKVRDLHSMENPSDLYTTGTQDVRVEWVSEEHGTIKVHVSLGPEDYRKAYEAHGTFRDVKMVGELERPGGRWTLVNPRDVEIV